MPFIEISLCDSEGNEISQKVVRLGVDTGQPVSFLYKSGVEAIFGSVNEYYACCKENGIENDISELSFSIYNIYFGNVKPAICSDFICRETIDNQLYDGLVGEDFLKKNSCITFDFKKNVFIVNGKKLKSNILPMKTISFSYDDFQGDYLSIPAKIDGETYDVIIDTGACSSGTPAIVISGESEFDKEVCVEIGNEIFESVKVASLENSDFDDKELEKIYKDYFGNIIILGNAFFQNHRIQLDFENMQFAMD